MLKRLPQTVKNDLLADALSTPSVVVAAILAALLIMAAVLAPVLAPQDPFDPAALILMDAFSPPVWEEDGRWRYPLGTDDQGRDVLSVILYGSRISLAVGLAAVAFSVVVGVALGLLAGFRGGVVDALLMRLADVQMTVPGLLIALMIDGVVRASIPTLNHEVVAPYVLIIAIGIAEWPRYARVVRGAVLGEMSKDYVAAARMLGRHPLAIMGQHLLPNVLGPVFVLATLGLALAIIAEATLSFLGVGMPATTPSLGTLIRIGNDYLFSGEWWITLFPSLTLVVLVLSVNLLGDWLRDALDPRLRNRTP